MQPTETYSYLGSLTPIQNLAIGTLLTGSIVTAAAKTVGVSRKTLHRWLKKAPGFIGEYIPEGSSVPTIRSACVKKCDTVRQSGTFADKPGRTQNESPMSRQAPSPKAREKRVESETCYPPSRAVLCPDTRREILNPEKRPDKIESLRTSSPHPLSPTPDSLPPEICDNTGQCETSAASPAHRPASDVQLLTSNSQLPTSSFYLPAPPKNV